MTISDTPGSLPAVSAPEAPNINIQVGADLDRPMNPKQFAEWIGRSADWVYRHLHQIPGVVRHSKKCIHIIPRYYVEAAKLGGRRRRP